MNLSAKKDSWPAEMVTASKKENSVTRKKTVTMAPTKMLAVIYTFLIFWDLKTKWFYIQILKPTLTPLPFVTPTSANCPIASAQKMVLRCPAIFAMWVPPVPTARTYLK